MYRVILAFCFVCTSLFSKSQDTLTFNQVESVTYRYFEDKNWEGILKIGQKALDSGIDYYYLRLRMGVARYEQKNYRAAAVQFRKAMEFNDTEPEPEIKEYLYYSYLLSGLYSDSRLTMLGMDSATRSAAGIPEEPVILSALFESGFKFSNRRTEIGQLNYFNGGIIHRTGKKVTLFHSISHLNQQVYWGNIRQNQYYVQVELPFRNSFSILPSYHYLSVKADTLLNSSNRVFSFEIRKSIGLFNFHGGYLSSNLFMGSQKQMNVGLGFLPFGNTDLVFESRVFRLEDTGPAGISFKQTVTIQPNSVFQLKLNYFTGNRHNFHEENGFIVNNSVDLTTQRYGAQVSLNLSKNIQVYGLYQRENKIENFANFNYHYNSLFFGLNYRPDK